MQTCLIRKRVMRVIAGTCVAFALGSPLAIAQPATYALSDWPCGIIVWPQEIPDYVENFTQRLTEAAETAFGFWGVDLPRFAEDIHDEANGLRVYDPATDSERIIPPLQWKDREIPPVVVFAFPNEIAMRAALGRTDLFGAIWCAFPMSLGFPNAEGWIREIGEGSRNMICPVLTPIETLIHEDAHWFTTEWCSFQGVSQTTLPNYITEGIAEVSCDATKDPNDAIVDRLRAIAWAQNNCLGGSIQGIMRYSVGESLVGYLIETLGTNAFLQTVSTWTRNPLFMVDLYQAEWRTSLGLAAGCPGEE